MHYRAVAGVIRTLRVELAPTVGMCIVWVKGSYSVGIEGRGGS